MLNFNIRHLHNICMQFGIVGYLPLVGAMFRCAESHLFSHHSMFRPEYQDDLKSIKQRLFYII